MQNIQRAWSGLKNAIDFDGLIRNIIGETGIHDTSEDYEPETTKYCDSAPGKVIIEKFRSAVGNFYRTGIKMWAGFGPIDSIKKKGLGRLLLRVFFSYFQGQKMLNFLKKHYSVRTKKFHKIKLKKIFFSLKK